MRCSGTRVGVGVSDGRGVDARVGAGVMDGKGVEVASRVRIGADACVGLDVTVFGGGDVGVREKVGMGEDNWQPAMLIVSRIANMIFPCHGRLLILFIQSSFIVTIRPIETGFHFT